MTYFFPSQVKFAKYIQEVLNGNQDAKTFINSADGVIYNFSKDEKDELTIASANNDDFLIKCSNSEPGVNIEKGNNVPGELHQALRYLAYIKPDFYLEYKDWAKLYVENGNSPINEKAIFEMMYDNKLSVMDFNTQDSHEEVYEYQIKQENEENQWSITQTHFSLISGQKSSSKAIFKKDGDVSYLLQSNLSLGKYSQDLALKSIVGAIDTELANNRLFGNDKKDLNALSAKTILKAGYELRDYLNAEILYRAKLNKPLTDIVRDFSTDREVFLSIIPENQKIIVVTGEIKGSEKQSFYFVGELDLKENKFIASNNIQYFLNDLRQKNDTLLYNSIQNAVQRGKELEDILNKKEKLNYAVRNIIENDRNNNQTHNHILYQDTFFEYKNKSSIVGKELSLEIDKKDALNMDFFIRLDTNFEVNREFETATKKIKYAEVKDGIFELAPKENWFKGNDFSQDEKETFREYSKQVAILLSGSKNYFASKLEDNINMNEKETQKKILEEGFTPAQIKFSNFLSNAMKTGIEGEDKIFINAVDMCEYVISPDDDEGNGRILCRLQDKERLYNFNLLFYRRNKETQEIEIHDALMDTVMSKEFVKALEYADTFHNTIEKSKFIVDKNVKKALELSGKYTISSLSDNYQKIVDDFIDDKLGKEHKEYATHEDYMDDHSYIREIYDFSSGKADELVSYEVVNGGEVAEGGIFDIVQKRTSLTEPNDMSASNNTKIKILCDILSASMEIYGVERNPEDISSGAFLDGVRNVLLSSNPGENAKRDIEDILARKEVENIEDAKIIEEAEVTEKTEEIEEAEVIENAEEVEIIEKTEEKIEEAEIIENAEEVENTETPTPLSTYIRKGMSGESAFYGSNKDNLFKIYATNPDANGIVNIEVSETETSPRTSIMELTPNSEKIYDIKFLNLDKLYFMFKNDK